MDPTERALNAALGAWSLGGGATRILRPLEGGHRNTVRLVEIDGALRVAKTTRRSEAALAWLRPVAEIAAAVGLTAPTPLPTRAGRPLARAEGVAVTLEPYLEGAPLGDDDTDGLARALTDLHRRTEHLPQRPGFASARELLEWTSGGDVDLTAMPPALVARCRAAWRTVADRPTTLIHGDANRSNALVLEDGSVALVDWDEARVDAPLFDRVALGLERDDVARRAALAWEVAVSWRIEPEHARSVAAELGWAAAT